MSLVEYLYVDERRLNCYFEQISSPITYDKVPVWHVGLSLKGPEAQGTQARYARQFTTHEKIVALMKHLDKHKLVDTCRTANIKPWHTGKVFRIETCRATKVFIPPKPESSSTFKGLSLWISPFPQAEYREDPSAQGFSAGALYLLEDYPRDDLTEARSISAYSVLHMLVQEIRKEVQETIAGKVLSEREPMSELDVRFSLHPVQLLSELGAQVGADRMIRSLYRIRSTRSDRWPMLVTISYPIFIAAVDAA